MHQQDKITSVDYWWVMRRNISFFIKKKQYINLKKGEKNRKE